MLYLVVRHVYVTELFTVQIRLDTGVARALDTEIILIQRHFAQLLGIRTLIKIRRYLI